LRVAYHTISFVATAAALLASATAAHADEAVEPLQFKLSGFSNGTIGLASTRQSDDVAAVFEGEIEVSPQYTLPGGTVIAARVVANYRGGTASIGSSDSLTVPEISAFAIGSFGRIEIGNRAGFPQSLIGFTPSEIAFTLSEYGPESGARLDPDGRLPTALLPASLSSRINALTYLGYAARFYDDRSAKIIYLSPRLKNGLYGALSFTPRTNRPGGYGVAGDRVPGASGYRDVVQAAAVWNHRTENLDLSIGATYSHATVARSTASLADTRRVDSISGGISATIRDSFVFGISATYDGLSSEKRPNGSTRAPYGVIASFNYVDGPWIAGGYYQHAVAPTNALVAGVDKIDVAQIGLSYLVDKNHDLLGAGFYTDVKLFASATYYGVERNEAGLVRNRQQPVVMLVGARFAFF
jgi:hypothetical protein